MKRWILGSLIGVFSILSTLPVGNGSHSAKPKHIQRENSERWEIPNEILTQPLLSESDSRNLPTATQQNYVQLLTQATVRVTHNGSCGSGTIVGHDEQENALVLTNAHVAGTRRDHQVNLTRWDSLGNRFQGQAKVMVAAYVPSKNIDFALLKVDKGFADNVTAIPLADRYPNPQVLAATMGCPRCEWPSLQVLHWNHGAGQVLRWNPEAIPGRSGSGVFELTQDGPRLVGLLTWGGGGEGLGQSTPFLLSAMRGNLPASIASLPKDVVEVGTQSPQDVSEHQQLGIDVKQEPAELSRDSKSSLAPEPIPDSVLDAIVDSDQQAHDWFGRQRDPKARPSGPVRYAIDVARQLLATIGLIGISATIGYLLGKWWK